MTAPARTSAFAGNDPSTADGEELVLAHIDALAEPLAALRQAAPLIDRWARHLADSLGAGGRLLVAGNGGSAAEAQHLTAEFVGRFDGDRAPFSAISLHAETSALTAIGNDYGFDQSFARQVKAHGRDGDVFIALSTSGRSPNVVEAAKQARLGGMRTWAMCGDITSPLAEVVDEVLALPGTSPSVQETQLVAIHAMCRAFDRIISHAEGQTS